MKNLPDVATDYVQEYEHEYDNDLPSFKFLRVFLPIFALISFLVSLLVYSIAGAQDDEQFNLSWCLNLPDDWQGEYRINPVVDGQSRVNQKGGRVHRMNTDEQAAFLAIEGTILDTDGWAAIVYDSAYLVRTAEFQPAADAPRRYLWALRSDLYPDMLVVVCMDYEYELDGFELALEFDIHSDSWVYREDDLLTDCATAVGCVDNPHTTPDERLFYNEAYRPIWNTHCGWQDDLSTPDVNEWRPGVYIINPADWEAALGALPANEAGAVYGQPLIVIESTAKE